MQTRAKHHEHHAHLGELAHGVRVSDKARREGTHHQATGEITHNGGQTQTARNQPANKRRNERDNKRHKKDGVSVHGAS